MTEIQPSDDAVATALAIAAHHVANQLKVDNSEDGAKKRATLIGEMAAAMLKSVEDFGYKFKRA